MHYGKLPIPLPIYYLFELIRQFCKWRQTISWELIASGVILKFPHKITCICYTEELFPNYLCNHFGPYSIGRGKKRSSLKVPVWAPHSPPRILRNLWGSAGGFCERFRIAENHAEELSHRTQKFLQNFGSQALRPWLPGTTPEFLDFPLNR